ncbi:cyclic AMP-dependent transcription factor ATF-4 [Acipenser oxyrinchus oxyrinchus]|uniref:Cyclic AMP-dependent transcription factor ATF-4 n=1 Tax=Acipenser oxyrinchus oxyrinchus TaxID=40147 RepID=A0AAD8CQK4_ACIOX|nr:cyclic AMP-dependent transcription factor ATF-4 [Acipenser oxyrinchus oxyrinchus]
MAFVILTLLSLSSPPLSPLLSEDAFSGMDWMAQKMDLSELDLDSLMDPCDSGALPSPPEDLLSSLGGGCDLDLGLGGYLASFTAEPHSDPSFIPEPPAEPELEPPVAVETIREAGFVSEPLPSSSTPALEGQVEGHPSFSLELGSEVDIDAAQETRTEPALLLWKDETQLETQETEPMEGYCSSDTDSGRGSSCGSPERSPPSSSSSEPRRAAAKPYSRPTREALEVCVSLSGHVKSADRRKMKKMEQNKTAATRYRQKKRSELDRLRGEREALEEKNRVLGEKAEAIATEIRYLTELMREVREARDRRLQQGKGSQ